MSQPSCTEIGAYPLVYFDELNNLLCGDCASPDYRTFIHWEGPDLICEECSNVIPSVYGNPDNQEFAEF